jgi:gluconokinase
VNHDGFVRLAANEEAMMSEEGASMRSKAVPALPSLVIVMGVSGSGKSTVGSLLAGRLQWEFEDGDWFHPPANVDKMHKGIPLTDEDRWPWLHSIASWIDKTRGEGGHGVIACSVLKRRYRDVLIGARADVRLVYLQGSEGLIARRIATRHEHFMPPALLHSQFVALEEPGADEDPIAVSIEPRPSEIVAQILSALKSGQAARPATSTSRRSGPASAPHSRGPAAES